MYHMSSRILYFINGIYVDACIPYLYKTMFWKKFTVGLCEMESNTNESKNG